METSASAEHGVNCVGKLLSIRKGKQRQSKMQRWMCFCFAIAGVAAEWINASLVRISDLYRVHK